MAFRVLMVCTGNTCRSPLAEGILGSLLPAGSRGVIEIASAGTAAFGGAPATPLAREVSERHGIDLSGHRSTPLTRSEIGRAGLVLAMAREHADAVAALDPSAAGRTFVLSRFAGSEERDVPDPMGGGLAEYESIFAILSGYLTKGLPRILAMAEEEAE